MARINEGDLVALGPWPTGANNLARETSVPRSSFREGVNIDVGDDGKVGRREGYQLLFASYEPHSLFGYGSRFFFVSGATLMAGSVDGNIIDTPAAIHEALTQDARLAHCLIEPDIYVSDGDTALRITPSNNVLPWSMPPGPTVQGSVGDGALDAGVYLIGLSCRAASGEEGPMGTILRLEVPAGSKLAINLPNPPDAVSRYVVYMTKPNGSELLLLAAVPAAANVLNINRQALGRPFPNDGLQQMPAGQHAAYFGGRLLVAVGDAVIWSQPHQYGLTQEGYNYALFSEPVTGLGSAGENNDGFFVGQQTRTYFMRGGDPAEAEQKEVYGAGMVPYSLAMVPGARLPMDNPPSVPVPVWLATNGAFVAGLPDGSVYPLTETRYAARVGADGAALFTQRDGINRLVVTTREPRDNNFAVTDSVSIEVVHNGIVLNPQP